VPFDPLKTQDVDLHFGVFLGFTPASKQEIPHGPQETSGPLRQHPRSRLQNHRWCCLYLLVRPNGSKLWRFKCRFGCKEKLLALGRYPDLALGEARLRPEEARQALRERRDSGPKAAAADAMTFEKAARAWHTHRTPRLIPVTLLAC
jgi:hypothetical protein